MKLAAALAIAAAPIAAAVVGVTLAVMGVAGAHPFWSYPPITLPEAVALRHGGVILTELRRGADPHEPMPVDRQILGSETGALSAWEAAVMADRSEVIELFAREGVPLAPDAAERLVCLAIARERRDSREALLRFYHADAEPECATAP